MTPLPSPSPGTLTRPEPPPPREALTQSAGWDAATPVLSVLIPFFRDDPAPLLGSLEREASRLGGRVELVALDDGGGDAALTRRVALQVGALSTPARLVALDRNQGRAPGRIAGALMTERESLNFFAGRR